MKTEAIFLAFILIGLIFISGCGTPDNNPSAAGAGSNAQKTVTPVNESEMVDCSKSDDQMCFVNRMNQCLPVTAKMTGSDGSTAIEITVLGIENETCHFQRKINNAMDLDCYFPKGTMNMDTLDQTFGNDKGLQQVVDDACMTPGW